MKSNKELGYEVMYGKPDYIRGEDRCGHEANIPGTSLTLTAIIGHRATAQKDRRYRVYAYTWHHEQDASREGVVQRYRGVGATPEAALADFRRYCQTQRLYAPAVDECIAEIQEAISELAN